MDDAAAGNHQVNLPGLKLLGMPCAVSMQHFALEQVADGRQANVWVRAGTQVLAYAENHRSEAA